MENNGKNHRGSRWWLSYQHHWHMNRWSLDQIMSPEFHYNFFSVTKKQIALFHPHYFVVKFFSVLQKTHTQNQLSIFIWVPSTQEGAPLMTKHDSTICWLLLKELPMLFKRSWSRLLTFLWLQNLLTTSWSWLSKVWGRVWPYQWSWLGRVFAD